MASDLTHFVYCKAAKRALETLSLRFAALH
jgi:glutaredoxin